jgi:hypothetical protein
MNPEDYLNRKPKRPDRDPEKKKRKKTLKQSQDQEERIARKLGGKTQGGSGAGRLPTRPGGRVTKARSGSRKGDVEMELLLAEAKTTSKASISVQQRYLTKITREAHLALKSPAFVISFPVMPDDVPNDWICVSVDWLAELMRKAGITGLEDDE